MANASNAQHPGIMSWVSSIRTTMANDPGRQFLEDQIQTNGFLFLEDYLESILAGPRHDPIIELVKTPGRKRDAPKRTRAATAIANKTRAITAMTFDDEDDFDKENQAPALNTAPMTAFHQALLKSKDDDYDDVQPRNEANPPQDTVHGRPKPDSKAKSVAISTPVRSVRMREPDNVEEQDEDEEMIVEELVTPPRPQLQQIERTESALLPAPAFLSEHTKELSIIEEGDEIAERSDIMSEPQLAPFNSQRANGDLGYMIPAGTRNAAAGPANRSNEVHSMDVDVRQQNAGRPHSLSQSVQQEPVTQTLRSADSTRKQDVADNRTFSYPVQVQTDDENEDDTLERKIRLKMTVPQLPSIGAPSPVRMSMRASKEPFTAGGHKTAGPSLTRSSWLVKAKEAKAIEENAKRTSAVPGVLKPTVPVTSSNSMKRKSGEMLELTPAGEHVPDSAEPKQKVSKVVDESAAPLPSDNAEKHSTPQALNDVTDYDVDIDETSGHNPEGMMNKLRKTVAGFSARAGKSMGKSLGGAAATALAEARAAAEAKIAERYATESVPRAGGTAVAPTFPTNEARDSTQVFSRPPSEKVDPATLPQTTKESDRRLSVSDLVTKYESKKPDEISGPVFRAPPPTAQPATTSRLSNALADISTSTTPPDSPPKANRPVFSIAKPTSPHAPSIFSAPPPPTVSRQPSHSNMLSAFESRVFGSVHPQPLSNHSTIVSTQSSIFSDGIFDNTAPMWGPSTQDTEIFEDPVPSQHDQYKYFGGRSTNQDTDAEGNESWHLDDKFTEHWTPNINMHIRDDEMTWNSTQSRSTNDTGSQRLDVSVPPPGDKSQVVMSASKLNAFRTFDMEEAIDGDDDMDVEDDDEDLGAIRLVPSASQSTTSLVSQSKTHSRSESQQSQQSSTNGQSQLGFFSSATKFVSSVLGGSKKKPEPVKSLQLAAAAAKKQQEEAEKKAARLKDMEARRQQVLQKKMDEDKAREEKRIREENERWKREREKEDTTEKRLVKQPSKKLTQMEDDLAKKRELAKAEKAETKKPPSKDKKDTVPTKPGKPPLNTSQISNAPSGPSKPSKLNGWANSSTTSNFKMADLAVEVKSTPASSIIAAPTKTKGKTKAVDDLSDRQPAKVMQAQMQARVQAQIKEAKKDSPRVASENIELPDIQSEYSDSDDEDRKKDLPEWVQSPELHAALRQQSTIDPDDIFGAIKPLKMEELFKNRTSRFRARTSSANWAGTDEVTAAEEREYARRMGYTK